MFSKPKISDTASSSDATKGAAPPAKPTTSGAGSDAPGLQAKPKPSPSLLSNDLTIRGNVITSGDIQIEGTIEGDVRAHLLTVGETATIKGEIAADDVVVNGRVVGRLRGLEVRLTSTAWVEGDIVHKTITIESGAHFEGTVLRQEDPLGDSSSRSAAAPASARSSGIDKKALVDTSKEPFDLTFGVPVEFQGTVYLEEGSKTALHDLAKATERLVDFLGYDSKNSG